MLKNSHVATLQNSTQKIDVVPYSLLMNTEMFTVKDNKPNIHTT